MGSPAFCNDDKFLLTPAYTYFVVAEFASSAARLKTGKLIWTTRIKAVTTFAAAFQMHGEPHRKTPLLSLFEIPVSQNSRD